MKTAKRFAIALLSIAMLIGSGMALGGGLINESQLDKVQIGKTTKQQVIELLGTPESVAQFRERGIESLGYWMNNWGKRLNISIDVDAGGVVRNIERLPVYGP